MPMGKGSASGLWCSGVTSSINKSFKSAFYHLTSHLSCAPIADPTVEASQLPMSALLSLSARGESRQDLSESVTKVSTLLCSHCVALSPACHHPKKRWPRHGLPCDASTETSKERIAPSQIYIDWTSFRIDKEYQKSPSCACC